MLKHWRCYIIICMWQLPDSRRRASTKDAILRDVPVHPSQKGIWCRMSWLVYVRGIHVNVEKFRIAMGWEYCTERKALLERGYVIVCCS